MYDIEVGLDCVTCVALNTVHFSLVFAQQLLPHWLIGVETAKLSAGCSHPM